MALSFIAGIYILSVLDFSTVFAFSIITIVVLSITLIRKTNTKNALILLMCSIMLLTGSVRFYTANNIKAKDLYSEIDKQSIIKAELIEKPEQYENGMSFIAKIISVNDKEKIVESKERVRFYGYTSENKKFDEVVIPELGDIITVEGKIILPKGPMNKGGFDYSKYLKTNRVFFQCDMELSTLEIKDHSKKPILHGWLGFRDKCMSFFDKAFPEDEASVLKAFIVGEQSYISDETVEDFSKSGLSHILAVSGMHVTVFISIIASILKIFDMSKRKQMVLSLVLSIFFVLFTGASVSAIRAGVMAGMTLLAKLVYRKADPLTSLSLSAMILCAFNPHVIYSASFLLSFVATAGIVLFYDDFSKYFLKIYERTKDVIPLYKLLRGIFDSLAVGVSVQIFTLPICVVLFNGFSVTAIIATMVVTPFLSALLSGGLLFVALSFISETVALPVGGFIFVLAKALIYVADFFAGLTFSKVIFGILTPFLLLIYSLVVTVIISLLKGNKSSYIISVVSLTILTCLGVVNAQTMYKTAQVSFINVGQGDCALIKAPGNCDILIDAGGYSQSETTGEYIIAPYLIENGVTDVEYIIVSHLDSDHIIGIYGLLDCMKIDNLIIPYGQENADEAIPLLEKSREKGVNVLTFTSGDVIRINDNFNITAITPDASQRIYAKGKNDSGIVVRLDYGESSFLFAGDISEEIEKYLIKAYPDKIDADVLKVAHHGSKFSTCQEFVDAVSPEYAYISVGKNTYGHPAPEVIKRLENFDTDVIRADVNKDATFYFDSDGIKGLSYSYKD